MVAKKAPLMLSASGTAWMSAACAKGEEGSDADEAACDVGEPDGEESPSHRKDRRERPGEQLGGERRPQHPQ